MILISNGEVTLFEVTIRSQWSIWIKSTERSDLVFLRDWLKLETCLLEADMNLLILSMLIGIMICLHDESLVIMLILGLGLFILPKVNLLISLIFLLESLEKFSLILKILPIFLDDTWVYKGLPNSAALLFLLGVFFPWNFNLARTFFDGLGESWGGGSFVKLASLVGGGELAFFPLIEEGTLVVNSFLMSS